MLTRVASIHFAPVRAERSVYGGMYDIPAVPLSGKPFVLEIDDKVQKDEGPISTGPGGGRRAKLRYHVDGYDIAVDVVNQWAVNVYGATPQRHPGVWIVRDRVAVTKKNAAGEDEYVRDGHDNQTFRAATPVEAKAMWEEDLAVNRMTDRLYAEWCYTEGNRIAADVRNIQFIPPNYKLAARQYGLQADWLKEGAELMVIPCPRCTKIISNKAIICPACNEPVDLPKYALWEAEKAAAVRAAKANIAPVAA